MSKDDSGIENFDNNDGFAAFRAFMEQLKQSEMQGFGGYNKESYPELLSSHDIQGIAKWIQSDKCKNISVLAGAGISVSAGIPDFRSKGGFYNTLDLSKYPLTEQQKQRVEGNSEYILTYELFQENPAVYITARREMILAPESYNATLSHWFLKLLHDKKLLKRYFSTNIDGLDAQIGLPEDSICNVHGTLAKAHCIKCDEFVDMTWFRKLVREEAYPIICPKDDCDGFVKPDTVLFGQSLPDRYSELCDGDLDDVDLFIVIGTSLAVSPSNYLPTYVDRKRCPRLLVNRDDVHISFDFDDQKSNDIWYKGNCDDGFKELTKLLGWGKDLYSILPDPLKENNKELLLDSYNNQQIESKDNDMDAEDEKDEEKTSTINKDKEALIANLLNTPSFMSKEEINKIWTSAFRGLTYRSLIIPMIHVQDPTKNAFDTVWKSVDHNIKLIMKYEFDGIFLTNHGFMCKDLVKIINHTREQYPKLWIGVCFLGCVGDELEYCIKKDLMNTVDGVWIPDCGVGFAASSDEIIKHSDASSRLVKYREVEKKWKDGKGIIFGGIEYDKAANTDNNEYDRLCKKLGSFSAKGFMHCVCTSVMTDYYAKIDSFKKGIKDKCKLAVSGGITHENVGQYLGVSDAILINTGLSDDDNFYNFNEFKMSRFRNAVKKYYEDNATKNDDEIEEKKVDGVSILSPVNEEPDNDQSRFKVNFKAFNRDKHSDDEDLLYQLYIGDADNVNNDLNGLYKAIYDESKLPQIKHKTDSLFTPNFIYYKKSFITDKEYGIFIIPSLEDMNIYKPTWVVAQINCAGNNNDGQQPIYYYASQVDFKQELAMKIPSNCDATNCGKWVIVGDDGTSAINMRLMIIRLKGLKERQRDFSSMYQPKNKEFIKEQIVLSRKKAEEMEQQPETKHDEDEEEKKQEQRQDKDKNTNTWDLDDHKISMVEMVGHDQILRVTSDIKELKREWNESELGTHDELEMFLGAIGKVIDIEEDDDTVKLEWINNDAHWLPVKACWIHWRDTNITAPNFYPDQDEENDDARLLHAAFGGDQPQ